MIVNCKPSLLPATLFVTLSLLTSAVAQRQRTPPATGSLSGYVGYSDTKVPARLAQVMLIRVYPSTKPTDGSGAKNSPSAAELASGLSNITQTGLDGRFTMPAVPIGKYIVLAQQAGALNPLARLDLASLNKIKLNHITEDQIQDYLADLALVTIEQGKAATASIMLTHGAAISGTFTYDDGSPAVGVQAHLLAKTAAGTFAEPDQMTLGASTITTSLVGSVTDESGRFHIAGLPSGAYALRATVPLGLLKNLGTNIKATLSLSMLSPDNSSAMDAALKNDSGLSVYSGNVFFRKDIKPLELSEGQNFTGADIVIPLSGMFSVQTQVEDAATGKPLDVAQVQLMDAAGQETLRAQFVDDSGDCTFEYVPTGQYTLKVVNAVDMSAVGKLLDDDFDPKKAVHYSDASTKIVVNGDMDTIVIRVSKPEPPKPAQ